MVFTIKIGIAYYNMGFINIKKRYDEYFGIHESTITVYLNTWDTSPFTAKVNRTHQPIGTPRIIMGNEFKIWIKKNHKIGDNLIIEMDSQNYPNAILIR
jgi:hypothetical protein